MQDDKERKNINIPDFQLNRIPHTIDDIVASLGPKEQHRLSVILQEFVDGFSFIRKYPKSVTFFGSARFPEGNVHYEKAKKVASEIVKKLDYAIITGGGPGIMEGANRGAKDANGKSVGLLIQLPEEQVANPYVNESLSFYYFFVRKVVLSFSAEAFLFFPGGFGTFDELFEILTLIQTHKIPWAPVILVGQDYWAPIDKMIKSVMLHEHKTIDEPDTRLYTITDSVDEILEIIKRAPLSRV
ncbi:MAG: TIGR00730 family Rossman fold protein [Candidatus Paceibacterota bacterium]|jgi:hypothetical protein